MEGSGGAFWRRCLGAGVRLLRATLALTGPPDLLYADPLVLSLIGMSDLQLFHPSARFNGLFIDLFKLVRRCFY